MPKKLTDPYLDNTYATERLIREYEAYGSLVVAYDFDDTVYDFHQKGRVYPQVVKLLQRAKSCGCYLIVWTANDNLAFVESHLLEHNIPFDKINENPPFWKGVGRKIYANIFLDDRAGLSASYQQLEATLNHIELNKRR